jgi:probable rRNA maturation factor
LIYKVSASVDTQVEHEDCAFSHQQISDFVFQVISCLTSEELSFPEVELSVLITDDLKIQVLNKDYRGKDYATDVLSFSQLEGEKLIAANDKVVLGDIVISYDTALRQAEQLGVDIEEEMSRLIVHGLLHLIGYEHEGVPEDVAKKMFAREEELLQVCKINF